MYKNVYVRLGYVLMCYVFVQVFFMDVCIRVLERERGNCGKCEVTEVFRENVK